MAQARLRTGAMSYLPLLATGPVITTNFDAVLEEAFVANGQRFASIIEGPQADRTVEAIHHNAHVLLKIHGSFDDRHFRVFTQDEYRGAYENDGPNLTSLAWITFTNRPLLFLGSSLVTDRTTRVLEAIHAQLPALRHYALLAADDDRDRQLAREAQLSVWGVRPIWYPPGEHGQVAEILREIVERAGTRELTGASGPAPTPSDTGERIHTSTPSGAVTSDYDVDRIAAYMRKGSVAFSLGSGAHLGNMVLGDELYAGMSAKFDTPQLRGDRSMVIEFVMRHHGPQTLWDYLKDQLDRDVPLGAVYEFLAGMPGWLRSHALPPMWAFTTNYGAVLERELRTMGEPFHLLYYMEADARFAHIAPDGAARVIERPQAIRSLVPDTTVIVKLNGGILDAPEPKESGVLVAGQFERLAAMIPDVLPACVRTTLEQRHLLFLGHGLNEADLQKVLRYSAEEHGNGAWVLQKRPTDPDRLGEWEERRRDFARSGAETLERPLGDFVEALHRRLSS